MQRIYHILWFRSRAMILFIRPDVVTGRRFPLLARDGV
jgi:hypothetical protein